MHHRCHGPQRLRLAKNHLQAGLPLEWIESLHNHQLTQTVVTAPVSPTHPPSRCQ